MEQTKLILSSDGTSACFKFPNGTESTYFKNEEEIISGLCDCLHKYIITETEAEELFSEIHSAFTEKKLFKSDYHSPLGYHRHKCKNCNYIWEHDGSFFCSHECPNCGKEDYVKYFGAEPPTKPRLKK